MAYKIFRISITRKDAEFVLACILSVHTTALATLNQIRLLVPPSPFQDHADVDVKAPERSGWMRVRR